MEKTKKNLAMAFVGESQARNRYTMYAKQAKKDGYPQIEKIFLETAENEREHAKWFFRMLNEIKEKGCSCCSCDMIEIEAAVPEYGDRGRSLHLDQERVQRRPPSRLQLAQSLAKQHETPFR